MYFRIEIESIMEKASLTSDEKNILVEKLTPYVLSYRALEALDDESINGIVKKIEEAQLKDEFTKLLEKKSKIC